MQIRAKLSPAFVFLAFVAIMLGVMCATAVAQQPVSANYAVGKKVIIEVTANGTLPLTYQWTKTGLDIPGATTYQYTISSAVETDAGVYACKISNAYGSIVSPTATLNLGLPPTIQGTTIKVTIQ